MRKLKVERPRIPVAGRGVTLWSRGRGGYSGSAGRDHSARAAAPTGQEVGCEPVYASAQGCATLALHFNADPGSSGDVRKAVPAGRGAVKRFRSAKFLMD